MKTLIEVLDELLAAYERHAPQIDQQLVRRVLNLRYGILRGKIASETIR